jgi:hypothetical protein
MRLSGERTVGARAEMDVIVNIDEASIQAVRKESGDEERPIPDLTTIALRDPSVAESYRQSYPQWAIIVLPNPPFDRSERNR